ncbi:MAG: hypothetical protein GYA67_11025 [Smithella sp.]|jgi:hypothetical protein|nr:hypothetical protein [Smithella sp.]HNY96004.1 hypothetical protein [Smithellaceae bacterium]HOH56393.1 hypothetical protein [Smithellaceae bacterium]HOU56144.1 hypothetical protein [Smithellaceae bacterium]HPB14844.1 hypothetical protein [Smithellaceae bacterium]
MQKTRTQAVIFLSIIGFSLGVFAMSFHHHDGAFIWPACSICKVKASLSGTFNKVKADTVSCAAMLCLLLVQISLCVCRILPAGRTAFIPSQIVEIYPNKAPPFSL